MANIDNNAGFNRKRKKKVGGGRWIRLAGDNDTENPASWILQAADSLPKKPKGPDKRKRVIGHTADSILT